MYLKLFLCYGLLMISIILLWNDSFSNKKIKISGIFFIISIIFALIFKFIFISELIVIIIFAMTLFLLKKVKNKFIYTLIYIFIFLVSILLMIHKIPGFNNYKLISNTIISKDAIPYSLYLNFDKTIVGFLIVYFFNDLIKNIKELKRIIKPIIKFGSIIILVLIFLSYILAYIKYDFKIKKMLLIWIPINLLFTCFSEEVFFRKFMQGNLKKLFKKIKFGNTYSILIISFLFGIAHFSVGIKYMFLAGFAGIGYGVIYDKTEKIESSIIVHFLLNLFHFLFFTYPVLNSEF